GETAVRIERLPHRLIDALAIFRMHAAEEGPIADLALDREARERLAARVPPHLLRDRVVVPGAEAGRLEGDPKASVAGAELELRELGGVAGLARLFVEPGVLDRGGGVTRGSSLELLDHRHLIRRRCGDQALAHARAALLAAARRAAWRERLP